MIYQVYNTVSETLPDHLTHPFGAFCQAAGYGTNQHTCGSPLVGVLELEPHDPRVPGFPHFVTCHAFADEAQRLRSFVPGAKPEKHPTARRVSTPGEPTAQVGVLLNQHTNTPSPTHVPMMTIARAIWLAIEKALPHGRDSEVTLDASTLLPICCPEWMPSNVTGSLATQSKSLLAEDEPTKAPNRTRETARRVLAQVHRLADPEENGAPPSAPPSALPPLTGAAASLLPAAYNLHCLPHLDGHENERSMYAHDTAILIGRGLALAPSFPETDPHREFIISPNAKMIVPGGKTSLRDSGVTKATNDPTYRACLERVCSGTLTRDIDGEFRPVYLLPSPKGDAWTDARSTMYSYLERQARHAQAYVYDPADPANPDAPDHTADYAAHTQVFNAFADACKDASSVRSTRGVDLAKNPQLRRYSAARHRPNGATDFGRGYIFAVNPLQWVIPAFVELVGDGQCIDFIGLTATGIGHLGEWHGEQYPSLAQRLIDDPSYTTFTHMGCADECKLRYVMECLHKYLTRKHRYLTSKHIGAPSEQEDTIIGQVLADLRRLVISATTPSAPHTFQSQRTLMFVLRGICPEVLTPHACPDFLTLNDESVVEYTSDSRVWLSAIWYGTRNVGATTGRGITPRNHTIRAARRDYVYREKPYAFSADDQRRPGTLEEAFARSRVRLLMAGLLLPTLPPLPLPVDVNSET